VHVGEDCVKISPYYDKTDRVTEPQRDTSTDNKGWHSLWTNTEEWTEPFISCAGLFVSHDHLKMKQIKSTAIICWI